MILRRTFLLAVALIGLSTSSLQASALNWVVDSDQSYLSLAVPNQKLSVNGQPWGNVFFRNQAGATGGWNIGNQAPIAGTIASDYDDFTSIQFLGGAHNLVALNSGSYEPNPADWDAGSQVFNPGNGSAPAAFGGQIGSTAPGGLLIVVSNLMRFSIRDVVYDLNSAVLPIASNQFAASATTVGVSQAEIAARGSTIGSVSVPSSFSTLSGAGIDIFGSNSAALGGVTAPDPNQPNLRELTLPISVPILMSLFDGATSDINGTATGMIVAYAYVPEPSSLGMAALALLALCAVRRVMR